MTQRASLPAMTERPIAFAAPMVRALLGGRKTQTRRVILPQPARLNGDGNGDCLICRHGAPGERLWVRERFAYRQQLIDRYAPPEGEVVYAADAEAACYNGSRAWRQSRYMPREASRILLEITACRAERVNRISPSDAIAEGFDGSSGLFDDPVGWFRDLWDQLNAPGTFAWESNPWVWVIEFKLLAPAPARRERPHLPISPRS